MLELQDAVVLRALLEGLPSAVYVVDLDRRIVLWNSGAERITGYLREEVVGRLCRDDVLVHRDENMQLLCGSRCPLSDTMRDGKTRETQVFLLHRRGHRVPVHVWAVPLRDAHGVIVGAVETFEEAAVTCSSDALRHGAAIHGCLDESTGIPDRSFTEWRLCDSLSVFAKNQVPFGILCISIRQLENFHISYGFEAEATVLRVVSRTLRNALHKADFLGRWDKNLFLAILNNRSGADVVDMARRLEQVVASCHVEWWGDRLPVKISVGGTSVQPGDSLELIFGRAAQELRRDLAGGEGNLPPASAGQGS